MLINCNYRLFQQVCWGPFDPNIIEWYENYITGREVFKNKSDPRGILYAGFEDGKVSELMYMESDENLEITEENPYEASNKEENTEKAVEENQVAEEENKKENDSKPKESDNKNNKVASDYQTYEKSEYEYGEWSEDGNITLVLKYDDPKSEEKTGKFDLLYEFYDPETLELADQKFFSGTLYEDKQGKGGLYYDDNAGVAYYTIMYMKDHYEIIIYFDDGGDLRLIETEWAQSNVG
ncbi:MAG: hypothetical protein IJP84_05470 [Lachnospiraceae bacterium]|nr:hypothetical protein [Lachnospiraceae bacterium]